MVNRTYQYVITEYTSLSASITLTSQLVHWYFYSVLIKNINTGTNKIRIFILLLYQYIVWLWIRCNIFQTFISQSSYNTLTTVVYIELYVIPKNNIQYDSIDISLDIVTLMLLLGNMLQCHQFHFNYTFIREKLNTQYTDTPKISYCMYHDVSISLKIFINMSEHGKNFNFYMKISYARS